MALKGIIIGAIVMVLLCSSQIAVAFGSNEEEKDDNDDNNNPFQTSIHANRPAINPDFAPDEDCVYDVSQIHCIPGSAQECPKPQFNEGDPSMCSPRTLVDGEWRLVCPDGYHYEDEDESGQCYPNDEGCGDYGPYVLIEGERGDRCALLYFICDEAEHRGEDYCIEYCNEDPDRLACKPEVS